jgi:transmembrane sensor
MSESPQSPSQSPVQDQAIEWLVKLREDDLDPAALDEFSQWLAENPRHIEAFAAAEQLFKDIVVAAQTAAINAPPQQKTNNVVSFERQHNSAKPPSTKRLSSWLAGAFGVAAVWLIAVNLIIPSQANLLSDYFSDYHTQTGELRTVQLSDGSRVLLNTNSTISVDFTASTRNIVLHHGQAQFTVAKDSRRPFTVVTNTLRTQALGTVFDVNHPDNAETSVLVQEHAVSARLTNGNDSTNSITIKEGQILHHRKGQALHNPESVNLSQATAWQQHKLIINDRPLTELITELERHHTGRVFIGDASLNNLRVSGVFSLNNPQDTLRIICEALNLQQTQIGPWWTVLHR